MTDTTDRSDEYLETWGEIDGAGLLDEIDYFAGRFLALPTNHHLVVVCLWALHTWALPAFYVTPRLILDSPEPESGKTRVLEVLALLCHYPRLIVSTSAAALYRRIDTAGANPPTVLQDEADAIWARGAGQQAEDLRAMYDSGYRRGATVDRCVGEGRKIDVHAFKVFAPLAVAGLAGKIPVTITSRGISLHMRRRAPDECVDEYRERDAAVEAAPLRERAEAWADANADALAAARPVMPDGVRDRRAEIWEALLAVADVAGGDWSARARQACKHFELNGESRELSLGARLLADVRTVFGDREGMFSADVIAGLTSDEESEWSDLWGKPLDQRRLAKELKRYGVQSQTVRDGADTRKGYTVDGDNGLGQAWHRYLSPAPKRHNRHERHSAGQGVSVVTDSDSERHKRHTSVTPEMSFDQPLFENVTDVTLVTLTDGEPVGADRPASHFVPPTGPGRCGECGWHIPTQGHRDDCPANPDNQSPL